MPYREYSEEELTAKAERYCALEEQCIAHVRQKLHIWGATPQTSTRIVQHLVEEGFIDERRFVRLFCQGKLRIKHWGRNKIAWELRSKGIDPTLVEEGLNSLDDKEYRDVLQRVAQNKYATLKGDDEYEKHRRLTAFLLGRGFTADEIRSRSDR